MNNEPHCLSTSDQSGEQLDDQILGSYVEYDPEEPCIPCGYHVDTIRAAIPVVVPLSYRKLIDELLNDGALVLENDVFDVLQTRFATDSRYRHLQFSVTDWDEHSKWISLEAKDIGPTFVDGNGGAD